MWVTDRGHLPTELFFSRNKLPKSTKSRRIKPTFWEEHCTECSVPECYKSCKLYTAKKDGSCRRFEHGIVLERGDYSPTARIFFKKWGKLQTKWIKGDAKYGFILYVSMAFGILHRLVETLPFSNRNRERFHRYFRNALERLVFNSSNTEEMFQYVLTLRSSSEHMPTGFVLEQIQDNQVINRITFNIKDKRETIRIPLKTPTSTESFVQIFPIMAQGVEVTFAELEIERTNGVTQVQDGQIEVQPKFEGKFVKCVAWDLDLTIWDEILTESNSDQLKIRPQIIETLEELDRRGILNVVISKNDFDSAMEQLRRFDLDKWFVGYSINWGEKKRRTKEVKRKFKSKS